MIDIHLHLLPGVDDGPRTLQESITMLDWFAAAGYTRLVATPHLMQPLDDVYEELVRAAFQQIELLARDRGIEVSIGYEHMVEESLPRRIDAGERSTLGDSKAILVEFPFVGWNYQADRVLYDLQRLGCRPVLAHPERYVEVLGRPDLVQAIAERGVVLQITYAAIAGTYGQPVRNLARQLLVWLGEAGFPFVLATDAHSPGRRLTDASAGRAWIEKHVRNGIAVVSWAGEGIPMALLNDEVLPSLSDWIDTNPARHQSSGPSRWQALRSLNPLARR